MVASSHERTWPPSRSRGHPSLRFRTNSFILPSLAILISGSLSSSSAHPEPGAKTYDNIRYASIHAYSYRVTPNVGSTNGEQIAPSSPYLIVLFGDVEEVTEEGLRHADLKLEARIQDSSVSPSLVAGPASHSSSDLDFVNTRSKSGQDRQSIGRAHQRCVLRLIRGHCSRIPFVHPSPDPALKLFSLQLIAPRTVLLRIYGPSSSILISRADELHTLHLLSSNYRIGPRVYGTFQNGRVEEWFDSTRSRRKTCVMHPKVSWNGQESLYKNIVSWQGAAQETLVMLEAKERKGEIPPGHVWHGRREELNLGKFMRAWEAYWSWLQKWESEFGRSEMVFAHNDAQYGNLLYANKLAPGKPEHHRIIVVDFEYAGPNPAAYDIANHFHEWTADYHSDTPHVLTASRYPTREERRNFYFGSVEEFSFHGSGSSSSINSLGVPSHHSSSGSLFPIDLSTTRGQAELEEAISILDGQVYAWSPASHAHWIIWGIIQASDDITNGEISDFDYLHMLPIEWQVLQ
ncbi:choline kinase, cytoplasm [Rhizoctonia solani]|uniref:Choline kinase, cytoplasm n=1 Tax=Rhizoctonia solani TaxID=456999 RepID=A0A8H8P9P2_9AGAM|nr:choline kinase, cytoplasm [Rhizoctonia solani]QRW27180.1 choline kinase, cytoplasm [Rhizoctonia solani]